jgi:hypothetical protein
MIKETSNLQGEEMGQISTISYALMVWDGGFDLTKFC